MTENMTNLVNELIANGGEIDVTELEKDVAARYRGTALAGKRQGVMEYNKETKTIVLNPDWEANSAEFEANKVVTERKKSDGTPTEKEQELLDIFADIIEAPTAAELLNTTTRSINGRVRSLVNKGLVEYNKETKIISKVA